MWEGEGGGVGFATSNETYRLTVQWENVTRNRGIRGSISQLEAPEDLEALHSLSFD